MANPFSVCKILLGLVRDMRGFQRNTAEFYAGARTKENLYPL